MTNRRNSVEARKVAREAYPYRACAICGLTHLPSLDVAHLDHNPANNRADNLAWLCKTHHWMFDCQLYPLKAVKMLRDHWQMTRGKPEHSARMKDAGIKAARTRKRITAARKAWVTRRQTSSD